MEEVNYCEDCGGELALWSDELNTYLYCPDCSSNLDSENIFEEEEDWDLQYE